MESTIENKINLVFILIAALFIAIIYVVYFKNNESFEHLDPTTSGSAYIYNSGNATLGNVTVTGKVLVGAVDSSGNLTSAGGTTIDAVNGVITVGTPANLTSIYANGLIVVGNTKISSTNGITAGATTVINANGTLGQTSSYKPQSITIGNTQINQNGDIILGATNSLLIGGTATAPVTKISADGTASFKSNTITIDNGGNFMTTGSISIGGTPTAPAISLAPTGNITVNGNLAVANGPKSIVLNVAPDGHAEMTTVTKDATGAAKNTSALIYTVDGQIKKYTYA